MTYLDYIVFFEKCDQQQRGGFSGNATRLYLKLLHLANLVGWPESFAKPDPYVAAVCGFSINTMKDCRKQLAVAGLVTAETGGTGRNAATTYTLINPSKIDGLAKVNPSNSDAFPAVNPSNSDGFSAPNQSNSDGFTAKNKLNPSGNPSNFDTLSIDKDKESSGAAVAASPPPAFAESSPTPAASPARPAGKKPKAKGATHADIATLPLPFDGAEFAEAWRTFTTTNTKQAGKAITAFELMLKKLGKYPEAFAVLMLERAIMGNWQGVENSGTPRDFVEWQAQQARRPSPPPAASSSAVSPTPGRNEEFIAEQQRQQQAAQAARFDRYAAQAQPEPALAA